MYDSGVTLESGSLQLKHDEEGPPSRNQVPRRGTTEGLDRDGKQDMSDLESHGSVQERERLLNLLTLDRKEGDAGKMVVGIELARSLSDQDLMRSTRTVRWVVPA